MNEWIPIDERKPEKFKRYLVCVSFTGQNVAWYLPKYDTWIGDDREELGGVTGWMELPKRQLPPGLPQEVSDEIEAMVRNTVVDIDLEFALKHKVQL